MDFSNFFINEFNYSSLYTKIYFNDTFLSSATSFCYKYKNELFLITNYHVVSGRDAYTNKVLDKYCALPNKLVVYYYDVGNVVNNFEVNLSEENILNISYEKDGRTRRYDVAAIKIDNTIGVKPFNDFNFGPDNILVGVAILSMF